MDISNFTKIPYTLSGGFNLDLVQKDCENLTENFICAICLGLVNSPLLCKENECIFCQECINSWLKKNMDCPNCKKRFYSIQISRLLKNVLNKIRFSCINCKKGCAQIIDYENFVEHIDKCDYINYKCNSLGCNFESTKNEIINHNVSCEFKMVVCHLCNKKYSQKEFSNHLVICKKTCPVCNVIVELVDVATHNNGVCYEILINFYKENITCIGKKFKGSSLNEDKINSIFIPNISNSQRIGVIRSNFNFPLLNLSINQSYIFNKSVDCHQNFNSLEFFKQSYMINCCICRNLLGCRFKCYSCKQFICYRCYYLKTKKYCPCFSTHVLRPLISVTYNCDICQEKKISQFSYQDSTCGIDICQTCTKS